MSPRWALRSKSLVRYENQRCMYARYSSPSRGLVSMTRRSRCFLVLLVKHHSRYRSRAIEPHCGQVADSVWAIPRKADPVHRQMLHQRSRLSDHFGSLQTEWSPCHQYSTGAASPTRLATGRRASIAASGMMEVIRWRVERSDILVRLVRAGVSCWGGFDQGIFQASPR